MAVRHRSTEALATDVWRLIFGFFWGNRETHMRVLTEFGLTPGDMKALFSLDRESARPMGWLASEWSCDASNVTWMVDRLEERGIVERRSLASDRRVKAIALTELGQETKRKLLERMYEPPPPLLGLSRSDLTALYDALVKLPQPPAPPGS